MAWPQPQQASYNLGKPNAAPTPRPKNLHCDICNKDFTANTDRDAHMAGTKHAKAVKSQQIITELKEKIPAATGINSMFRCATCDITLNSSQQLATHLSGSRHKLKEKMTKGGAGGGIVLADKQEVMAQAAAGLKVTAVGVGGTTAAVPTAVSTAAVPTAATSTTGTNAAAAAPAANGAAAKPKTPAEKAAKPPVQTFKCVVCDVDLNSESQRDQHLNSKKHADKMAGRTVSTSRGFGAGFRGRGTPFSTRDRGGRGSSFSNGDRGRGGRGRAPNTRGGGFSPGRGRGFGGGNSGTGFGGSNGGTGFGGSSGGFGSGGSGGSSGFGGSGGSSGGFGSGGSFGGQVGIGRGRAAGTSWIGSGGGYTAPSGNSGGNVKLEGSGDSSYGYQGYGYSGVGTGGADSGFGGGVKMETGDQGDFFTDDGQFGSSMTAFSSGCAQTAGGGSGGGEFTSPGGPVFRGRGLTHASLPYSRPPPLPTGPPPQQPPPPAY